MGYSRDGDQLCSNFAIAFAFCALILGIVTQSTCSFISINPIEVLPNKEPRALQYLPWRNITVSNYTINVGFWRVGTYEIDGQCRNIQDLDRVVVDDKSFQTSRAMGILASVTGFVALVVACFGCHRDDEARRRKWNVGISALYFLAGLASWLTMLMFNTEMCQGKEKTWTQGKGKTLEEILTLKYGGCYCRAGCFLSICAALCYTISAIIVLIKTG